MIALIVSSKDREKIDQIKLNEIKGMIESFSIKEEKFVDETYYMSLGVSFNKKKVFNYLEEKNIFPSIPKKKNFLFIPIIIDENKKDLLIFYNNKIYETWNKDSNETMLVNYILPTEDLEDLNLLKSKFDLIEQYDFEKITSKYDLKDSIIALIFKSEKDIRILSKITLDGNLTLKNQSFKNMSLNNTDNINIIINELKIIYEDFWKKYNQINTSIRLNINIKVKNKNNYKLSSLEKTLNETDLVYDFFISKFDKDFTFYEIVFNGSPDIFLKRMKDENYNFNTQNKIWILE